MALLTKEDLERAGEMDLLTYLQLFDPGELVHVSGQTWCTRTHDSLKISNGKWYWFSRGIGGVNALQYLTEVEGRTLPEAAEILLGRPLPERTSLKRCGEKREKKLLLPPDNGNADRAVAYLEGRGIHPDVIRYCLDERLIYESGGRHLNVVFVGRDDAGTARYAALREIGGPFKGDAAGSDKRYAFSIPGTGAARHLHVFEAAVDLLSYATLIRMKGWDWRRDSLLSLGGVFPSKKEGVLPPALSMFLAAHPEVRTVHLHLDRDDPGRAASKAIRKNLDSRYAVLDEPPVCGKDVNDQLMATLGMGKRKEEPSRD